MSGLLGPFPAVDLATTLVPDIAWSAPEPIDNISQYTWDEIVTPSEDWAGFYILQDSIDSHARVITVATGASDATTPDTIIALHQIYTQTDGTSKTKDERAYIPIPIAAGRKVFMSAVGITTVTSKVRIVGVSAASVGGPSGLTRLDSGPYDFDAAWPGNLQGAILDRPTANNTKSPWTEISILTPNSVTDNVLQGDSLPFQYKFLGLNLKIWAVSSASTPNLVIDLAHGAAGSEVIFLQDYYSTWKKAGFNSASMFRQTFWIPWDRPAGDRISVRWQAADISLIGQMEAILAGLR